MVTDHLDKAKRSWNMSRIHSNDTKAELTVRKTLHAAGYRFRLHRKDLPGSPDIVMPKYRLAIFVHGCYWHRHIGCVRASEPKSNKEYWTNKFKRNVERDDRTKRMLEDLHWQVIVLWECEIKKQSALDLISYILKQIEYGRQLASCHR